MDSVLKRRRGTLRVDQGTDIYSEVHLMAGAGDGGRFCGHNVAPEPLHGAPQRTLRKVTTSWVLSHGMPQSTHCILGHSSRTFLPGFHHSSARICLPPPLPSSVWGPQRSLKTVLCDIKDILVFCYHYVGPPYEPHSQLPSAYRSPRKEIHYLWDQVHVTMVTSGGVDADLTGVSKGLV